MLFFIYLIEQFVFTHVYTRSFSGFTFPRSCSIISSTSIFAKAYFTLILFAILLQFLLMLSLNSLFFCLPAIVVVNNDDVVCASDNCLSFLSLNALLFVLLLMFIACVFDVTCLKCSRIACAVCPLFVLPAASYTRYE